jgi:hypothetical protein
MENGKWRMEDGKLEDGKMEAGGWRFEDGKWKLKAGKWRLENGIRATNKPLHSYFGHAQSTSNILYTPLAAPGRCKQGRSFYSDLKNGVETWNLEFEP